MADKKTGTAKPKLAKGECKFNGIIYKRSGQIRTNKKTKDEIKSAVMSNLTRKDNGEHPTPTEAETIATDLFNKANEKKKFDPKDDASWQTKYPDYTVADFEAVATAVGKAKAAAQETAKKGVKDYLQKAGMTKADLAALAKTWEDAK